MRPRNIIDSHDLMAPTLHLANYGKIVDAVPVRIQMYAREIQLKP